MKKILDLIRVDIITMNGGKNSMKTIFVLLFIISGVMGILFSPLLGLWCPLLMGGCFVTMLFQNELKYHSEKLHSLLPINRRDLVNARFLLTVGLYTVMFVIFYLLMLLSLKLKTYFFIMGDDGEYIDIIAHLAAISGGAFSELGLFNLFYFSAFSFGLMTGTATLRNYFKNSDSLNTAIVFNPKKETRRKELIAAIIVFGVILFWILIVSDILPITAALLPVLMIFLQLAEAANGFLMSAVMVTIAIFSAIHKYVCTVVEYDEKEL